MSGRTIGNLILMTLICVVVFIVFMAVRPTKALAPELPKRGGIIRPRETHHPAMSLSPDRTPGPPRGNGE